MHLFVDFVVIPLCDALGEILGGGDFHHHGALVLNLVIALVVLKWALLGVTVRFVSVPLFADFFIELLIEVVCSTSTSTQITAVVDGHLAQHMWRGLKLVFHLRLLAEV